METDWDALFLELSKAIGDWENSPYFLAAEDSFDLDRFLRDHGAGALRDELEKYFGKPLNEKFWSSQLAFHRLKKVRDEIRAQDQLQDEKRAQYLEALTAEREAQREWFKEWVHRQRREQLRVIPGGKSHPGRGDGK